MSCIEPRDVLICRAYEGLCNRLNALASALATDRPVRLQWAINKHCPARFEELFERFDDLEVINEEVENYPYVLRHNAFCWCYPKNLDKLPPDVFRCSIYAAYRRLLNNLRITDWARPQMPALGVRYRHFTPDLGAFGPFMVQVTRIVQSLEPCDVHVASDSSKHKRAITRSLNKLGVHVVTNANSGMTRDLERSLDSVRDMCRDLRSLSACKLGVLVNSTRSSTTDPLRGFGVHTYYTFDDGFHRHNGRDDLFEMRSAAHLVPEHTPRVAAMDAGGPQ